MKARLKLWVSRLALRWLRKLLDAADDRLHAAEVNLREVLRVRAVLAARPKNENESDTGKHQQAGGDARRADHHSRAGMGRRDGERDPVRGVRDARDGGARPGQYAVRDGAERDESAIARCGGVAVAHGAVETFQQWEARRSGVAVISKKEARRRRGITARAFDFRFATGLR